MNKNPLQLVLMSAALALLGGCGTYPGAASAMFDGDSQVQARSYQTRVFDTPDTQKALRHVIATLQDLGFVIEKADAILGTVTATKEWKYRVRATVSVRPHGMKQVLIRMNAQSSTTQQPDTGRPMKDPVAYQDFFTALGKSMFLDGQMVN